MFRRCALLAALAPIAPAAAQKAPLRYVAGLPVVKAELRAGDRTYTCHLLVDTEQAFPLLLHRNAAGALRAPRVDVVAGDLTLAELPVQADRVAWLEQFTARHAEALHEVPLAGILGLPAFGSKTLVLDGPGQTLELTSEAAGIEKPPKTPGRAVLDLLADPLTRGIRVPAELPGGRQAAFFLATKTPYCTIRPELATAAGRPAGDLQTLRVGGLNLAAYTPFRPEDPPGGLDGSLGGRLLASAVLQVQLGRGWLALELPAEPDYPEVEAELYRARYGPEPVAALQAFLERHATGPEAEEAASALLEMTLRTGEGDPALLQKAALHRVRAAKEDARATTALRLLAALPGDAPWSDLRQAIAEAGLEFATADLDGNAAHKLRLELGRLAHARGDRQQARRHLLAAVFGMPGDGPANLALGRLYEDLGQLERARARYLLALLDMERTGSEGLQAFERVHRALADPRPMVEVLQEMAEGRVPALHPIPREPEEVHKTGRTVLVELFTGAQCPPCVAADIAFDALGEFYDPDEVVRIQWHLPIPAPEPLVSAAALRRAGDLGVNGTPTAFLGDERIAGGGRAEQGSELFARYRQALDESLALPPELHIEAAASRRGDRIEIEALVKGRGQGLRLHAVLVEDLVLYPGRNGMLFHHKVARAYLTPPAGSPIAPGRPLQTGADLAELRRQLDATVAELETEGRFAVRPTDPDPDRLEVVLFVTGAEGQRLQAAAVPVREARGDQEHR